MLKRHVRRATALLLFAALSTSCSEKDEIAPPPPSLDPLESPTRAARILVSGTAEYGSMVQITGGQTAASVMADPFSAVFRAFIDLNMPGAGESTATTTLSLTATDEAGNTSEATTVSIVYDPLAGTDIEPPAVSVYQVNGYYVCPDSGVLTDAQDLSDCATRTAPATLFRRGSLVVVTLRASDARGLDELSYKATGTNVSAADFVLVPEGDYVPGSDYEVTFAFSINSWADLVTVTGRAIDTSGNVTNSAPAVLEVSYPLSAGERTVEIIGSGPMLSSVWDVAVAPDGSTFAANNDNALPAVLHVDPASGGAFVYVDFFPAVPEFTSFDAAGNLYTVADDDNIWQTDPTGATTLYLSPGGNPEGMDVLAGGTPATGYWFTNGGNQIANDRCLSIETGAASSYIAMVTDTLPCSTTCAGAGALSGVAPTDCLSLSATNLTALEQAQEIATFLNTKSATTGVSAFAHDDCGSLTNGRGNGDVCVAVVAGTLGTAPAPLGALPVQLDTSDANWSAVDVSGGADADTLYVADNNNDRVHEVQLPPGRPADVLRNINFGAINVNGNLIEVASVVRRAKTDPAAVGERLFLYVSDTGGQVIGFDDAGKRSWLVANGNATFPHVAGGPTNDRLAQPEGVVYVPAAGGGGDCLLVSQRAPNNVLNRGEILAYTDLDDAAGQPGAPEGDLPIVTGLASVRGMALDSRDADPANWSLLVADDQSQLVLRIGRSASTTDCF